MIVLLLIVGASAVYAGSALAQMQTLVSGRVQHGGYGGPIVQTTWIDGEPGVLVGAGGAWIIDGTFAIGGQGVGLATTHKVPGYETRHTLEGGYGGVTLEYMHRSHELVNFSGGTLIGAGGMALLEGPRSDPDRGSADETAFFVARPYAGISLNVAHFFKIYGTAAYRFVSGSTLADFDDAALSGAELGIGLRFGSF